MCFLLCYTHLEAAKTVRLEFLKLPKHILMFPRELLNGHTPSPHAWVWMEPGICTFHFFLIFFFHFLLIDSREREREEGERKRRTETSIGGLLHEPRRGDQTHNHLICGPTPTPLSHASQGGICTFLTQCSSNPKAGV